MTKLTDERLAEIHKAIGIGGTICGEKWELGGVNYTNDWADVNCPDCLKQQPTEADDGEDNT